MIENETAETPTVFRVFPEGDVIALFPAIADGQYGQCSSYLHFGQHGAADYGHVIRTTRQAKPEEYADLMQELASIGYTPKLYLREQPWMHRERMQQHVEWARMCSRAASGLGCGRE